MEPDVTYRYRPMVHPHFVRADYAAGLGAAEEQLGLWEVDWTRLEELGPEIYGAALLGPIQGALLGMDSETIDSVLRIYLQTYGVLELYKQLMGILPLDPAKLEADRDHLMAKSMKMYQYAVDLMHQYKEARQTLMTNLAAGMELDAADFHKAALAAGWTQAQIDQALAEGKKLYTIKPIQKQGAQVLLILALAAIVFIMMRS